MNVALILEGVLSAGLFTSATLGLLVGAFYGFEVVSEHERPSFPIALWTVGLAFVISLGILAASDRGEPLTVEANVVRGILWTVLCACIPLGRRIRLQYERWRIRRRTKKLQE